MILNLILVAVSIKNFSNIQIYKLSSLTQLSNKEILLKAISHHISQLHVSARFYGDTFGLKFTRYCIQVTMFCWV